MGRVTYEEMSSFWPTSDHPYAAPMKGGGAFAAALAARDLVDEYFLAVQPVAVGQGKALFAELPASRRLRLVESRSFPSGVVVNIYRPLGR